MITTEKQLCGQCGEEITPCANEPCPSQGRYNGYADCPLCGAILYSIDGEDFDDADGEDFDDA